MKRRIGILSVSDRRERVHESLVPVIEEHAAALAQFMVETGEVEPLHLAPIHSPNEARQAAQVLLEAHAEGVVFNCAVFGFPHLAMITAQLLNLPILLYAPREERYPALTGLLTIGGALSNVGIHHARLWGSIADPKVRRQLSAFFRAASAVHGLRGQVYGLLGGRSMGLYTAAPSIAQWQRQFGVDSDHVDQYEIVRRAEGIAPERVALGIEWLQQKAARVEFDGAQLTREKLERQVRAYLATKDLVSEYQFDFVGIKCHYELSEYYVTQCLTAAFLNDPYDWEGPKEPTVISCEADSDAALTMQVLKIISGGPASLLDLRFYDERKKLYVLNNCGAAPTWFAAQSDSPEENMARVELIPAITKFGGGGAHVRFLFRGGPYTVARLQRHNDEYNMVIARAEALTLPLDTVAGTNPAWPHVFLRMDASPDTLVAQLDANHLHLVPGDYVEELKLVSEFLGIKTRLLDA